MKKLSQPISTHEHNDITLVLDCPFLCYKAFYTMGELAHEGAKTGVIFGFLSQVLNLAQSFNTSRLVFCWDSRHSFRREQLPSYKENRRKDKPPELIEAYKSFKALRRKILPAMGFKDSHVQRGLEADDIIAEVVKGQRGNFVIVSADEDLFQLLANNVRMYNPSKKKMMTYSRFREEFFIRPTDWARAKCLMGCKTDNVPGIQWIGQVFATKYIRGILTWKGQAYKRIKAGEAEALERNWPLIALPHPKTRPIKRLDNVLDLAGFTAVCWEYGLKSFMQKDRLAEWKEMFL